MNNARETVMRILYEIEYNKAYSNIAIKDALDKKDIKDIDKAFITRLVYGVISRKFTIDQYILQNSKIKLKKISKFIYIILQTGIYQLKFMDKIPQSAAVNESVKLAKRYGHGASAGFVNGVLHSVIKNELVIPDDKILKLAYEYSFTPELCEKWCNDFGYEFTKDLLESLNEEPGLTLRVNTLKSTADELIKHNSLFKKSEIYENALNSGGFNIARSKEYNEGLIYPQDISAMMASLVLSPKKGERVMDMCAAPGGKTTHMAALMENRGEIIASDVYSHKLDIILANAKRLGIDIIKTNLCDATGYCEEYKDGFDKILADVPCTGLGIIRKKPEIKWKEINLDEITGISERILTNASKYVKIGGEIVFSTCTINREENEEVIKRFLKENENFEAVDITNLLPQQLRHDTSKDGYITFYPNVDNIDGFFIAKIKRCK